MLTLEDDGGRAGSPKANNIKEQEEEQKEQEEEEEESERERDGVEGVRGGERG